MLYLMARSSASTNTADRNSRNCSFAVRSRFSTHLICSGLNGEDLRPLPLLKRKARLRKLIRRNGPSRLLYLDHIENDGSLFFAKACELDLEGIVAKWKAGAYVAE
jgi:hypothetical protein